MKKILIIEDDSVLQNAIKTALIKEGFDIQQAFNGNAGMEKIKEDKPDLILLDLVLPGKDGYHILYELANHENFRSIPVVVLSAVGSETSIEECLSAGAKDYCLKSKHSLDDIVKKIKENL